MTRRNGVYYFRGFIPKILHSGARIREVRVSLRTKDIGAARTRMQPIALAFDSLCGHLRGMQLMDAPDQDIVAAVQSFGRELLRNAAPPPSFGGANADYEYDQTLSTLDRELLTLETAISQNDFTPYPIPEESMLYPMETPLKQTHRNARQMATADFPMGLSPQRFGLLCAGIARAQREELKHFRRRLEDPFAPLLVSDPLFAKSPTPPSDLKSAGPTFADAVQIYTKAKAGVVWTKRTEEENRRILRLAAEHFGANTSICAITLDNVRAFRDSAIAWCKKPSSKATLLQISDAPVGSRIGAKSAAKYFGYLSAAFAHWTNEGYLDKNPAGKLTIHIPHHSQASARIPFSLHDLKALFSSPIFTGCASKQPRTVKGVQQNAGAPMAWFVTALHRTKRTEERPTSKLSRFNSAWSRSGWRRVAADALRRVWRRLKSC